MADFDFISGDEFRASLTADYAELEAALGSGSWKAAHVLAGSIIEAMLIDYIAASKVEGVGDPLKLDLAQAITIAKAEKAISDRAAGLSHVVRDYRNLIHPGRVIRLRERVDQNSAMVAKALVDMMIDEMSRSRAEEFGMTAEQLVRKIEGDPGAGAILSHLLDGLKRGELERLLLKVVPDAYFREANDEYPDEDFLGALENCYRRAFDKASKELKTRAAQATVEAVRSESAPIVAVYEEVFFRGSDLELLTKADARLIKDHVISRLSEAPTEGLLLASRGIGASIAGVEVMRLTATVARLYAVGSTALQGAASELLRDLYTKGDELRQERVKRNLTVWEDWLSKHAREGEAQRVREYRENLDIDDIPF